MVWFPTIRTKDFAPRAISVHSQMWDGKWAVSEGTKAGDEAYEPRELRGRHRTTTLMLPSPCSAIGFQACDSERSSL